MLRLILRLLRPLATVLNLEQVLAEVILPMMPRMLDR